MCWYTEAAFNQLFLVSREQSQSQKKVQTECECAYFHLGPSIAVVSLWHFEAKVGRHHRGRASGVLHMDNLGMGIVGAGRRCRHED